MEFRKVRSILVAAVSTSLATSTLGKSGASNSEFIAMLDVVQPTKSRLYGIFSIAGQRVVAELEADAMVGANWNLALDIAISRAAFFDPSSGLALATS